jgi:hypothetical protein
MPPNNGMHPTTDMMAVMKMHRAGRRVMPGVSWLELNYE